MTNALCPSATQPEGVLPDVSIQIIGADRELAEPGEEPAHLILTENRAVLRQQRGDRTPAQFVNHPGNGLVAGHVALVKSSHRLRVGLPVVDKQMEAAIFEYRRSDISAE